MYLRENRWGSIEVPTPVNGVESWVLKESEKQKDIGKRNNSFKIARVCRSCEEFRN